MALAWAFILNAGETADITLLLSTVTPGGGFYLQHLDPDSQSSIFFSSGLQINGSAPPPPDNGLPDGGATFSALLLGLAGLAGFKYKFARN